MRSEELDYDLPPELIAQRPAEPRDSSRLLVLLIAAMAAVSRENIWIFWYLGTAMVMMIRTRVKDGIERCQSRVCSKRCRLQLSEIVAPGPRCARLDLKAAVTPRKTAASEFWTLVNQPGGATKAVAVFHEARKRDPSHVG